jgi:putative transposase
MNVFRAPNDFMQYLALLRAGATAHELAVHAYVVMTNHIHLLVTPPSPEALPRTMQRVAGSYARFFNRKYSRTGTLWEGRYRSTVIEDERYLLTCHRYIELNPARAGITEAESYPWSSHRFYVVGTEDPLVSPHPMYLQLGHTGAERQSVWRAVCAAPLAGEQLAELRYAVQGRAIGAPRPAGVADRSPGQPRL